MFILFCQIWDKNCLSQQNNVNNRRMICFISNFTWIDTKKFLNLYLTAFQSSFLGIEDKRFFQSSSALKTNVFFKTIFIFNNFCIFPLDQRQR